VAAAAKRETPIEGHPSNEGYSLTWFAVILYYIVDAILQTQRQELHD
jgi:hypothetical protein